ncbi:MAG: hypothetical protein WCE44_00010 [Candidatus Velthaea sp.]|jgi:hypothetical protein
MSAPKALPWIPPGSLVAGHVAYGLSWLVLASAARPGALSFGLELAWVHLVALGWITTIALAVLIHVIPGFTGATWRGQTRARGAIIIFVIGAALLCAGLGFGVQPLLPLGSSVVIISLVVYLLAALGTLTHAGPGRQQRSVAAALALALLVLGITAALGYVFAFFLGPGLANDVLRLAPAHAVLGIVGWLTILATGVSTRTFGPIFGAESRFAAVHGAIGNALTAGSIAAAAGIALRSDAVLDLGLLAVGVGALAYAFDGLDIARRAAAPHRPPQAFALAALIWLLVAVALVAGNRFGAATLTVGIFVALAGWLGQMVNAHMHQLGVRLIATLEGGDEAADGLLDPRTSWFTFAAAQVAVLLGTLGLVAQQNDLFGIAGIAGFAAFLGFSGNVLFARGAASRRGAFGSP